MGSAPAAAAPPERLPELFDPTLVYREMGLLTDNSALGIIGSARILAGPTRDSLVVVVGLSMRNRGLAFRRQGDEFIAEYQATVALHKGTETAAQVNRDERVRVATFRETQRSDESLIFQAFLATVPGDYTLELSVRDMNGPGSSRLETPVTVPSLQSSAVALPIAVYQATPRTQLNAPPAMIVNPRSAVAYGTDTLRFYVEAYNAQPGSRYTLEAVDGLGHVAWQDTIRADSQRAVTGWVVSLPPSQLSIGRYELRMSQGTNVLASTPFLVAFSDQYAAANLQDIVSLLRYFAPPDTLRALTTAPPDQRAAAWQKFWKNTDPNPATPENEAIEEYLRRVQIAIDRFRDEGEPGWLTERGEVFITLGEPSEITDRRGDSIGRQRFIQWTYDELRLVLTFFDDTGSGHFRLDPRSRSEFQHVANRIRM